ncbi:MAG: COX15/CtaA family protein [Bacteroidota bacterium]
MNEYKRALHWYTVFVSFCTVLLLVAGGLVTSTGSGLAVPDWPLSYGQVMPPMVGGIFFEHGHRMIASFVGFLTVILTFWIMKVEKRRWVRWISVASLAAVILQGLLGGLTVYLLLPPAVSASHATLAQTFFCLVASLALFSSRWWLTRSPASISIPRNTMVIVAMSVVAVYIQLILGSVMRHTDSGLAVPDFPLAYGQLVPSLSSESLAKYNEQLIRSDLRLAADGAIERGQIVIHMLHRFWAVVTSIFVIASAFKLRKLSGISRRFGSLSLALIGVVVLQFSLGALTVLTHTSVEIATAHQTVGALLLVTVVLSALHLYRIAPVRLISEKLVVNGKEAVA